MTQIFKKYSSSLAEYLVLKLPKPPNNFEMQSVSNYYKKCSLKENVLFAKVESDNKVPSNFDESKAPGIDDLSGMFLKDEASLLTTSITQLCNLSISSRRFPDACKIAKLKPFFKKASKKKLSTTYVKSPGVKKYMNKPLSFLTNAAFYINFNQGFEKIILLIFVCPI